MGLTFANHLTIYFIALIIFLAIDLTWLGVIAKDIYQKELKKLLLKKYNVGAAFLFYALFVLGLVYFAIVPALNQESLGLAMANGAAFGFFSYVTYDLTNLATLKGWSKKIVGIDIVWGTVLGFIVGTSAYSIAVGII